MARSGASRYALAPGDVYAHCAAYKAADLAHFLSEAGLYTCMSGEWSSDAKSADDDTVRDAALVARARLHVTFQEIVWTRDRWRCTRCQRYARNVSTLAALRRTACVPLFGTARGAPPSLPRVPVSHKLRRSGPITLCTSAEPTARIASLRCRKVVQASVRREPDTNVFASWSSAAIRLPEFGCWMHSSLCEVL